MIIFCKKINLSIKHLILIVFFLFIASVMYAQKNLGEAKVECPNVVKSGEQFYYTITLPVDSSFHEIVSPPFISANLDILTGPSLSESTNYYIVNGKSKTTYTKTYTYCLIGKSVGEIRIPSYIIKSNLTGNYYTVTEKTILCNQGNVSNDTSEESLTKDIDKDKPFCLTSVDKTDICVDDSILVTTRLYVSSNYPLASLQFSQRQLPDFCFCQFVSLDSVIMKQDSINGIPYNFCVIDSYWLHPCKTGVVEIPTNSYSVQVQVRDESVDPIEAFFNGGGFSEITFMCNTNPVKVNIRTSPLLKDNSLTDFNNKERTGAVFALDISGSMNGICDFGNSRLDIAKCIIKKSVDKTVSVIPFAAILENRINLPMMSGVLDKINHPKEDGTALYDLCMSVVTDTINNYRDIIILTDGADNCSHVSLNTITNVLQKYGVRVNIVNINSERDSVLCKSVDPDTIFTIKNEMPFKSDLLYITRKTGGLLIKCKNNKDIAKVVKEIITIPKRPYKEKNLRRNEEILYTRLKRNY